MNATIPQVAHEIQTLLGPVADELAEAVGLVRRERTVTGSRFAQALVFGLMSNPCSSMEELSQSFTNSSQKRLSRQGLDGRFTARAAWFMERLVEAGVQLVLRSHAQANALLNRFKGVYVLDSTVIRLPEALRELWAGCGGSGLKVHVCMDLCRGGWEGVQLTGSRTHDQAAGVNAVEFGPGSLRLTDLGYFNLDDLQQLDTAQCYWISRYKIGTHLFDADGQPIALVDCLTQQVAQANQTLDLPVQLGQQHRLKVRLLATRAPHEVVQERRAHLREWERKHQCQASPQRRALCQWTLYLTNVPPSLLDTAEVALVYRLRWQIELLFKRWKSQAALDTWRTHNPWRILCEVYAKLLACLIQHWCSLLGDIHALDKSYFQAAKTITKKAWQLAASLADTPALELALAQIVRCLQAGCRISYSASSPPSFQQIKALS